MKIIYLLRRFNGDNWYSTGKAFHSYNDAVRYSNETYHDDMFNSDIVELELIGTGDEE